MAVVMWEECSGVGAVVGRCGGWGEWRELVAEASVGERSTALVGGMARGSAEWDDSQSMGAHE